MKSLGHDYAFARKNKFPLPLLIVSDIIIFG